MNSPCKQTYQSIRLQEIKDRIGKMSIAAVARLIYDLEEFQERANNDILELVEAQNEMGT